MLLFGAFILETYLYFSSQLKAQKQFASDQPVKNFSCFQVSYLMSDSFTTIFSCYSCLRGLTMGINYMQNMWIEILHKAVQHQPKSCIRNRKAPQEGELYSQQGNELHHVSVVLCLLWTLLCHQNTLHKGQWNARCSKLGRMRPPNQSLELIPL